jgi:hypothetical protein
MMTENKGRRKSETGEVRRALLQGREKNKGTDEGRFENFQKRRTA